MKRTELDRALTSTRHDLATLTRDAHQALTRLTEWATRGYPTGGDGRSSDTTSSTERAAMTRDPFGDRHRSLVDAIRRLEQAARAAATICAEVRAVAPLDDQPDDPCGNLACTHICTGHGNDRIRRPRNGHVGLCWRCYKHWGRHGALWPYRADGHVAPDAD